MSQPRPSSWLPKNADEELRAKAEVWWQKKGHQLVRAGCDQFRKEMRQGKVVEFADADQPLRLQRFDNGAQVVVAGGEEWGAFPTNYGLDSLYIGADVDKTRTAKV